MRFRAAGFRSALASLLTAMMLCFSFAAAACETRCNLNTAAIDKPAATSCHGESNADRGRQQQAMSPMPGMDPSAMGATGRQPEMVIGSQACTHPVCVQQPAVLSSEPIALAHATPDLQIAVLAASTLPLTPPARGGLVRGSPHLQSSSPIALRTTLRL